MSDELPVLTRGDFADSFCGGCQGRTGLLPSLFLGMNKRDIGEPKETENVAQIGFLKIEGFTGSALFIRATAGSDDHNTLFSQKALPAVWPVDKGLPHPHNLVDPCLE